MQTKEIHTVPKKISLTAIFVIFTDRYDGLKTAISGLFNYDV